MTLTGLPGEVGVTVANLSILKTGTACGVRIPTQEAICAALASQPGDRVTLHPITPAASADSGDARGHDPV